MSRLDEIKSEIEKLSSEEFTEIFHWLSEKKWETMGQGNRSRLSSWKTRFSGKRG